MFDRHDISPVISGNQLIGVYKQPATVSPSYDGFFNEVWNPKSLNEQWKEFDNYLNITWFLATHDSGIQWQVEGGTNFWTGNLYSINLKVVSGYDWDLSLHYPSILGTNIKEITSYIHC